MWKAIWWGFAGLLLGVALAGAIGAALGAVVGTLIGSVAGALHFHWHRSAAVCEPEASGSPVRLVVSLAAAVPVVYVLAQVAVALVVVAALAVLVVAGLAYASRRWARRLSVITWHTQRANTPAVVPVNMRARIAAPPRALPAPPRVVEGVIIGKREVAR